MTNHRLNRAPAITPRDVFGLTLVAAALVVAFLMIATPPPSTSDEPTTDRPTFEPSGERAEPCAETDRACNEWIDVQESQR